MISHSNVINQLRQMRQYTPVEKPSTVLGILPFYHSMCSYINDQGISANVGWFLYSYWSRPSSSSSVHA